MTTDDDAAAELLAAAQAEANNADGIASIGELVRQVRALEANIADREEALGGQREKLRQLVEQDIPDAMLAANCASFKTVDGQVLTVDNVVHANISEANAEAAFAWLRENGHGDLIKAKYTLNFGKGEEAKSAKLATYLKRQGIDPTVKESVHPQTLAAFVREQLADSQELPADILGIHEGRVAKFKAPKGAKKQ